METKGNDAGFLQGAVNSFPGLTSENSGDSINNQVKAEPPARELTYGEKAVGITFNPGGHPVVNDIKKKCAAAIDAIYDAEVDPNRGQRTNGEKIAQAKLAIRAIQEGQMWGVKAVTWQYD